MAKKMLVFIMVLLYIVLCSACNSDKMVDASQTEESAQNMNEISKTEETATDMVEFHIIVNPELKIYTDVQGIVQSVKCLNEDAEKVCQGLKLEGGTYRDAFALLVERLHAEGYMEGREVTIRVAIPVELGAEVPIWEHDVEKAWISALEKQSASCSFTIQLEVQEDLDEKEPNSDVSNQDQPEDDERFEKVEKDSNGNIIMTVEKDPDGNTITAYYDTYPDAKEILMEFVSGGSERYFYSADGSLERQISVDLQDVTVEQYYENSALTHEIIDGGAVERYYENGILSYETQNLENGRIERFYNSQGVLERVVETWQTSTITEVYHPDGWLKSRRIENEEGFREDIYQADGVLLSEENSAEGVKFIYDMSGNMVEAYGPDNYGRASHVFWLADRTAIIYTHEFDGTVTKTVQAPNNGTIISVIQNYTGAETAEIGTIVVLNAHQ